MASYSMEVILVCIVDKFNRYTSLSNNWEVILLKALYVLQGLGLTR